MLETCRTAKEQVVPNQPRTQPTIRVNKTRSCNYSLDTPDDKRKHSSKHVQQPRNNGIINLSHTVASCWSFYKNCVTMHGTMNVKTFITSYEILRLSYLFQCLYVFMSLSFGPTHHLLKRYMNVIQRHLRLVSIN